MSKHRAAALDARARDALHARDAADIAMSALSHGHRALQAGCWHGNSHTGAAGNVDLFRVVPIGPTTANVGESVLLRFSLEYKKFTSWYRLTWEELELYHGARCRVNVMSRDGTDFFHLHANASSPYTTEFYVRPTFLRPVDHLLAASYVTETNRLGVCIAEIASHAHGQDAERGVFPQLTDAWVVSVGDGGGVGGGATTAAPPDWTAAATTSSVCAKDGAANADGLFSYDGSYELSQSSSCCCGAGGAERAERLATDACAARCASACIEMEASIESIEDGVTPGSQIVYGDDGAPKPPAQRCLKVTIDVLDGGGAFRAAGAPVTDLQPYLMAAARIFIVPTDAIESYETGGSRHELVTHAHAYATELAPIITEAASTGLRLQECEDWSKIKWPMDPTPPEIRAQPLLADQAPR